MTKQTWAKAECDILGLGAISFSVDIYKEPELTPLLLSVHTFLLFVLLEVEQRLGFVVGVKLGVGSWELGVQNALLI